MTHKEMLSLSVNDRDKTAPAAPGSTLLTVLRDELGITSAKRGCNQGVCGSCTVLIDGLPRRACLTLAAACEGKPVRTIDGLADDPTMAELQRQFRVNGAIQCGFCTSGMLVSSWYLLQEKREPSSEEIRAWLSGNLCRCTGYQKIVESVAMAAKDGMS